jgi:hypothetical protein
MTVSDLLERSCNKSDNAIKFVTSCWQSVPNLLQQLGTRSANTTDDNKLVATCYEQPSVLVLLEKLVASLLPSSTL